MLNAHFWWNITGETARIITNEFYLLSTHVRTFIIINDLFLFNYYFTVTLDVGLLYFKLIIIIRHILLFICRIL